MESSRNVLCLSAILSLLMTATKGYSSRNIRFTKTDPTSILPALPNRVTSSVWSGIPDVTTCAHRTFTTFPSAQGLMYNPTSGRCTPVLGLVGSSPSTLPVQSAEGNLYLTDAAREICGDGFQIYELGTTGELACLRYFGDARRNFYEATDICSSYGAYLANVRTVAMLQVMRSLAIDDTWIGLHDMVTEGVFVWTIAGDTLTFQQLTDLFEPGEPNDYFWSEDCGEFDVGHSLLNDDRCSVGNYYLCEKILPGFSK